MLDVSSMFNIIDVLNGTPMALNGISRGGATVPWNGSPNSHRERVWAIGGGADAQHQLWKPVWMALCGISIPLGVWEAADLIGESYSVSGRPQGH